MRFAPTPGRSTNGSIPSCPSCSRGPMPERSKIAGVAIAPAERIMWRPATRWTPPPDGNGTTLAVEVAAFVLVILELAKVRKHLLPAPGVVAEARPFVVVGRGAAQGDRAVDGRRAARCLAARVTDLVAGPGIRDE